MLLINDSNAIRDGRLQTALLAGGEVKIPMELFREHPELQSEASSQLTVAVANSKNYEVTYDNIQGINYVHFKLRDKMESKHSPIKISGRAKVALTGLALLVSSIIVHSVIKEGFAETYKNINYGVNCASLNYGGKVPRR